MNIARDATHFAIFGSSLPLLVISIFVGLYQMNNFSPRRLEVFHMWTNLNYVFFSPPSTSANISLRNSFSQTTLRKIALYLEKRRQTLLNRF